MIIDNVVFVERYKQVASQESYSGNLYENALKITTEVSPVSLKVQNI